jgi:hypothetical protein
MGGTTSGRPLPSVSSNIGSQQTVLILRVRIGTAPTLEGRSNARDNALQIARLARPAYRDSRVSASSCRDRFVVPGVNLDHEIRVCGSGGERRRGVCRAIFIESQTAFTAR